MATIVGIHQFTDEDKQACLEKCDTFEKYSKARKIFERGGCPFCLPEQTKYPLIEEASDHNVMCWHVTKEYMRKPGLRYHFLIVPRRHHRFESELADQEVLSMHRAIVVLTEKFKFIGGITATRFGEMSLNAGSVPHLHKNVLVPNGTDEYRIPVFKSPRDRARNRQRADRFALRYENDDRTVDAE